MVSHRSTHLKSYYNKTHQMNHVFGSWWLKVVAFELFTYIHLLQNEIYRRAWHMSGLLFSKTHSKRKVNCPKIQHIYTFNSHLLRWRYKCRLGTVVPCGLLKISLMYTLKLSTIFAPLAAQGPYQSHFRWALIKTLISRFFSLKLVIFEKKINGVADGRKKP